MKLFKSYLNIGYFETIVTISISKEKQNATTKKNTFIKKKKDDDVKLCRPLNFVTKQKTLFSLWHML